MLPWWGWLLLWTVLLAGGAVLIGWRLRSAWRSAAALGREAARASAMVADVESALGREPARPEPSTAVTQDPHRLRTEHRLRLDEQRERRSARRAARMPPWARVDS